MDDKSVDARTVVENQYVSIIGEELSVKTVKLVKFVNMNLGRTDVTYVVEVQFVSTVRERSSAKIVEGELFAFMES